MTYFETQSILYLVNKLFSKLKHLYFQGNQTDTL